MWIQFSVMSLKVLGAACSLQSVMAQAGGNPHNWEFSDDVTTLTVLHLAALVKLWEVFCT